MNSPDVAGGSLHAPGLRQHDIRLNPHMSRGQTQPARSE
jgi:hypothetical protein